LEKVVNVQQDKKTLKPESAPLAGVRVLDLTTVLMGPLATQLMGDMGADIIKIEAPDGDLTRDVGPRRHEQMAGMFLQFNRNKRSVVLDLKKSAGKAALLKLAESADVFIYNVRPQAMERLGLTYEVVSQVNPRIIYCGCYGYGQDGPYAAKPAYDDLIQGATGIPALVGIVTGEPRYLPTFIADKTVGLTTLYAVLAALFFRERTGKGQAIDVPMFETMAQYVLAEHLYGKVFAPPLGEAGYVRLLAQDRKPYATQDGYVCALCNTDTQWQRFFELSGRPHLKTDPRFANIGNRTQHIDELYAIVVEAMREKTTAEWLDLLEKADIPCMPMHTLDSLLDDTHLRQVGFFETVVHPTEGPIINMGIPVNWSASAGGTFRHAPQLGEHTEEVLREAGYSDREIAALLKEGTVAGR
jgi:crotonobetainyl-CoA:carnitine CoA-transferase CaiB-like acyl-CoA transferase